MATIKITVEPQKSEEKVFTGSQLAEAIRGRKPTAALVEEPDELVDALWAAVCEEVKGSVQLDGQEVKQFKQRLRAAKVKKRRAPGNVQPGMHKFEITVVPVEMPSSSSSSAGSSSKSKAGAGAGPKPGKGSAGNSNSNAQDDDDDDDAAAGKNKPMCSVIVTVGEAENSNDDSNANAS